MIEALACGTPVVAFRGGSVPEVIEDGKTGFIVDTLDEAIEATRRIDILDRRACRDAFERRFSSRRMAEQYVASYARVIDTKSMHMAARRSVSSNQGSLWRLLPPTRSWF